MKPNYMKTTMAVAMLLGVAKSNTSPGKGMNFPYYPTLPALPATLSDAQQIATNTQGGY